MMERLKKSSLPLGPVFSVTLIGVLLLSAFLYYRAVKIQRFLEPALAISQPRIKFSRNINNLLIREFGKEETKGIRFRTGSIIVEQSLLFPEAGNMNAAEPAVLEKFGRFFLSALNSPDIRDNISIIMVAVRVPADSGRARRDQLQNRAEAVLNSIYKVTPDLERRFGTYFVATTLPVIPAEKGTGWMEFRIIPSEMLHIEVLQRLEKYSH